MDGFFNLQNGMLSFRTIRFSDQKETTTCRYIIITRPDSKSSKCPLDLQYTPFNEDEYLTKSTKMHEELEEYESTGTTDTPSKNLGFVGAHPCAVSYYGVSFEDLEKVRVEKAEKRGGFEEQIFLMDVEED